MNYIINCYKGNKCKFVLYADDTNIQGGPKVSLHTLGLIPTSCFILEGCFFADGILYLLVRGFCRQTLKIRIS